MKNIWYTGSGIINCRIQKLENTIGNHGIFYEGVVSFMPGISNVELIEQGKNHLIIQTNEGNMKRTNIKKIVEPKRISIEFDEEYKAGKITTANSHFFHDFKSREGRVDHKITISDVKASGIAGFFYRVFGSSNIGNAVLLSHKKFLESSTD